MTEKNKNENIIKTLKNGVIISSAFIITGTLLTIFEMNFLNSYTYRDIYVYLLPENLAKVGVFLLILTPIFRVIAMLIQYIREKNKIYITISLAVIIILIISFIIGLKYK